MNQHLLDRQLQNVSDAMAVKAYAENLLAESTAPAVRTGNPTASILDFA